MTVGRDDPLSREIDDYEARWRREEAAERAARIRARESAFKRNVRFARRILPEEVARRWLGTSMPDATWFEIFDPATVLDPESGLTGPRVAPNPGDPHRLLRAALAGDPAPGDRAGRRLRGIYRDILAPPEPAAQPEPAASAPPPPPASDGAGGLSALPGVSSTPETAPPAPGEAPSRPGGIAGGLF